MSPKPAFLSVLVAAVFFSRMVSAQGDSNPPVVTSFSLDRTIVNVASGPQTIYGRFEATDDVSGFNVGPNGYLWGYVQLVISESLGRVIYSGRPDGGTGFRVVVNEGKKIVAEFALTIDSFVPPGTYYLNRLQFYDRAGNLFVASTDWLRQRGFPHAITVMNSGPTISESTRSVHIPHFAAGQGWTTRLYIYGPSLSSASWNIRVLGANGSLILQRDLAALPAQASVAIADFAETGGLTVGRLEITGRGSTPPEFCAVALFSNRILRQEALSAPSCVTTGGHVSGPKGRLRYVYDHRDDAMSGFAFANTGTSPVDVALRLYDQNGILAQQRFIRLPGGGHQVLEVTEPKGAFGRMEITCAPGCSEIYSLGFRFNSFGAFTLMPFTSAE